MSHKSSCSTSGGSCSHGEEGKCGCGCGCSSSCGCGCQSGGKCGCKGKNTCYSDQLLALADEAWEELLKDKIKAEILKKSDKNLTELAQAVTEANHIRWKALMTEKSNDDNFKDRLQDILSQQ